MHKLNLRIPYTGLEQELFRDKIPPDTKIAIVSIRDIEYDQIEMKIMVDTNMDLDDVAFQGTTVSELIQNLGDVLAGKVPPTKIQHKGSTVGAVQAKTE